MLSRSAFWESWRWFFLRRRVRFVERVLVLSFLEIRLETDLYAQVPECKRSQHHYPWPNRVHLHVWPWFWTHVFSKVTEEWRHNTTQLWWKEINSYSKKGANDMSFLKISQIGNKQPQIAKPRKENKKKNVKERNYPRELNLRQRVSTSKPV